jgi:hypothetical protein
MVVEAVWSTDSHTLGDGTFRGDIQPGTATVRLWDPTHALDQLDKQGAVWARYAPTGACWCWFYDSFTRGLVAPGDPMGADCVFTGTMWPTRLTAERNDTGYPSQSVSARMAAIVSTLNTGYLYLPAVTGAAATQSQLVTATTIDANTNGYPSFLAVVRAAAPLGVAWMSAAGGAGGPGSLTLNYARWEAANARTLDRSQIIAGPPVTAAAGFVMSQAQFVATAGADGTTTSWVVYNGPNEQSWGMVGPLGMRMWGNVNGSPVGPEHAGAVATLNNLTASRSDATEPLLSTIDVQSGRRTGPTGGPSSATWDPYAHTFAPTDTVAVNNGDGTTKTYRVAKSDHRLTATSWQTTHTLDKYCAASPLP